MKHALHLLASFAILLAVACGEKPQQLLSADTIPVTDSASKEAVLVFNDLTEQNDTATRYGNFRYAEGDEPDVDVFNPEYEMILTDVDATTVRAMMQSYGNFCKANLDSAYKEYQKDNGFIVDGTYAIQLDYRRVNGKVRDIVCLIYGEKRYVLLEMGFRR